MPNIVVLSVKASVPVPSVTVRMTFFSHSKSGVKSGFCRSSIPDCCKVPVCLEGKDSSSS